MAHILLVEDDPDVGEAVSLLLEDVGHDVALVTTGLAALEACQQRHPDLLMVDVSLPGGMDGLELTRTLRRQSATQALPVLLVSARAHEDDVAAGMAAGANGYVVKPFRPEGLVSLVEATVSGPGEPHLDDSARPR